MIGKICSVTELEENGFRYRLKMVGESGEVRCQANGDKYKIDDLVVFTLDGDGNNPGRIISRASNDAIWTELNQVKSEDEFLIEPFEVWSKFFDSNPQGRINTVNKFSKLLVEQFKHKGKIRRRYCQDIDRLFTESINNQRYDIALFWLLVGADPDCADPLGNTPLMRSVAKKNIRTTELLLLAGAHPLSENSNGVSAQSIARDVSRGIGQDIKSLLSQAVKQLEGVKKYRAYTVNKANAPNVFLAEIHAPTQNQDGTARNAMSVGDAQVLQDMRSDLNDASRDVGYFARDDGGYGSHSLMDDYGDESSP